MKFFAKRVLDKFPIGTRAPLLFVHIPKTAGMSLRHFLANQYHKQDVCPANDWNSLSHGNASPGSHRLVQGHFGINIRELLPPDVRTLVVLRDPIERTLSSVRHMQRDPRFHALHHRVKDMTIGQIFRDPALAGYFKNVQTSYLSARRHPEDLMDYLRKGDQSSDPWDIEPPADLELAKRRLDSIEIVGFCKDIGNLYARLCREMMFHFPLFPPRLNDAPKTQNRVPSASELNDEERELLRQVNNLDIELYNYAKSIERHVAREQIDPKTSVLNLCAGGIYKFETRSFEIDITDLIPGSGWWDVEHEEKYPVRWTGPQQQFSLELPISGDSHYRARFRFWSPMLLNADTFQVVVNGQNRRVKLRRKGIRYDVSFVIDKESLLINDSVCELVFSIPDVIRPSDTGSPDLRALGISVASVVFDRIDAKRRWTLQPFRPRRN